jgi:hypothetical protein
MNEDIMSQPCADGSLPVLKPDAEPSAARTFSVRLEKRRAVVEHMTDLESGVFVISADPLTTKTEGGSRISMGFPVLLVSGWVGDAEEFAGKVAKLLGEHQP